MPEKDLNDYILVLSNGFDVDNTIQVLENLRLFNFKTSEKKNVYEKEILPLLIDFLKHEHEDIVITTIILISDQVEISKSAYPELINALKWRGETDIKNQIVVTLSAINDDVLRELIENEIDKTRNSTEKAYFALILAKNNIQSDGLDILTELYNEKKLSKWFIEQYSDLCREKVITEITKKVKSKEKAKTVDKTTIEMYNKLLKEQEERINYLRNENDILEKQIADLHNQIAYFEKNVRLTDRRRDRFNFMIRTTRENKEINDLKRDWKDFRYRKKDADGNYENHRIRRLKNILEYLFTRFRYIFRVNRIEELTDQIFLADLTVTKTLGLIRYNFVNDLIVIYYLSYKPLTIKHIDNTLQYISGRRKKNVIIFTYGSMPKEITKYIERHNKEGLFRIISAPLSDFDKFFNSSLKLDSFLLNFFLNRVNLSITHEGQTYLT